MRSFISLIVLLICMVGCTASHVVPLQYSVAEYSSLCSGEITVVAFEDKRSTNVLGVADGKALLPDSDVAHWVSWSLFEELQKAGADVKYRTTSQAPFPDVSVSGEVLDVQLSPTGTATYNAKVYVRIMIFAKGDQIFSQKIFSELEDVALIGYGSRESILTEALRLAIHDSLPTITAMISSCPYKLQR